MTPIENPLQRNDFSVIEGYTEPGGAGGAESCTTLKAGNTCSPLRGTCVEFYDWSSGMWKEAEDILAVTPTHLVVRSPIGCTRPATIRVKRLDAIHQDGMVRFPNIQPPTGPPTTEDLNFCQNAPIQ